MCIPVGNFITEPYHFAIHTSGPIGGPTLSQGAW